MLIKACFSLSLGTYSGILQSRELYLRKASRGSHWTEKMKNYQGFGQLLEYLINSSTKVAGLKEITFPKYCAEFSTWQRLR